MKGGREREKGRKRIRTDVKNIHLQQFSDTSRLNVLVKGLARSENIFIEREKERQKEKERKRKREKERKRERKKEREREKEIL